MLVIHTNSIFFENSKSLEKDLRERFNQPVRPFVLVVENLSLAYCQCSGTTIIMSTCNHKESIILVHGRDIPTFRTFHRMKSIKWLRDWMSGYFRGERALVDLYDEKPFIYKKFRR